MRTYSRHKLIAERNRQGRAGRGVDAGPLTRRERPPDVHKPLEAQTDTKGPTGHPRPVIILP